MINSLRKSKYWTFHIHTLNHLSILRSTNRSEEFIKHLSLYKTVNNKKIKIISLIRNPVDRLMSSFFQSYFTNEITSRNIKEQETTIMKYNIEELSKMFIDKLKTKTLPYYYESLYELSDVFNVNIIQNLIKKDDWYYYENDLIELYVLDFKKINDLDYINNALGTNILKIEPDNLSSNKASYAKYNEFKSIMKTNEEYINIVKTYYKNEDISFFYDFTKNY
jgi:hypothetical protein